MAAAQLNVLAAALALWYLYRPHVRSAFEAGAEAVIAARNTLYRTPFNEPLYWLSWVYKASWKPRGGGGLGEGLPPWR